MASCGASCGGAFAGLGVQRWVAREEMTRAQVEVERVAGNLSVGDGLRGLPLRTAVALPAPLAAAGLQGRSATLRDAAPLLCWRPELDGVVVPEAWAATLCAPAVAGWEVTADGAWVRRAGAGDATVHRVAADGGLVEDGGGGAAPGAGE